jgi:hypothetical protein
MKTANKTARRKKIIPELALPEDAHPTCLANGDAR